MSNYQRNTSMVACIVAVLVIGAVSIGLFAYYGSNFNNWTANPATTDFHFGSDTGTVNETVTLDIDLSTGGVSVVFVDNESLLYDIDITVDNSTLATEGNPTVTFVSNTIGLEYTTAGVNVTLGSGVNYTLNIHTTTGGISVVLAEGSHIGDISLLTSTGGISLTLTNGAVLLGNPTFDIESTTGGISIVVVLPNDVGGSFEAVITTGDIVVTATGWNEITSEHYETSDYETAPHSLTITTETSTGGISAVLM